MSIETEVMYKVKPIEKQLLEYGFILKNGKYHYQKRLFDNAFIAMITVDEKGAITGKVLDREFLEEYIPLRLLEYQGQYATEVRKQYMELLEDIKKNCFQKEAFLFPQTNRIVDYVFHKYRNSPEFLWKDDDSAVFREPTSQKWYGIIMQVDYAKLNPFQSGIVEIINVKADYETIQELMKEANFYAGYHMNKKSWLTIVLDGQVDDETVCYYIDWSYQSLTKKGEKIKIKSKKRSDRRS